jgi:hypothetical protein
MNTQTIRLIGIGQVSAVPLREVAPGDYIAWNYDSTSKVISMTPVGAKSVRLVEQCNGKEYTRVKRLDKLVHRIPPSHSTWIT